MKIYLEKAIFINRAPFERLELDFHENEVAVLSAVNGRGKTTVISHIVDAFYEMARPHFINEFEDKENKFYRVSSAVYNLDQTAPSFVYLRFKINNENIDYIDIRNSCTEEQYDHSICIENKIPYTELQHELSVQKLVKKISANFRKEKIDDTFSSNLLTYFPSYRYEQPGYLNDIYKIKLDFKKSTGFSGYLKNPIEVVSGLPQLANWIMDIVLDLRLSAPSSGVSLFKNINSIITHALFSKSYGELRFGIGQRGLGGSRIQVVKMENEETVYPTIFNLSSGESSMLCLFGELLKQADSVKNNVQLSEITGIVLIDEVDKHLHIRLQKEVLPQLFNLFPNVQFITSSHSPFLGMGLAEKAQTRSKIVDLDNLGISTDPITNNLYNEVYEMMISENDRFKKMYESLELNIKTGTKPIIITEGKTDVLHLKKAKQVLGVSDLDVEFYETTEPFGESKLMTLLEQVAKIPHSRKIIGIFDRDVPATVVEIEKNNQFIKHYSNDVFAFCIPIPAARDKYTNISIEFYYSDAELKKMNHDKCLYFDNELEARQSVVGNKDRTIHKLKISKTDGEFSKKIFSGAVDDLNWMHSKTRFAELVAGDSDFSSDFNFNHFKLIFDKIREIISIK